MGRWGRRRGYTRFWTRWRSNEQGELPFIVLVMFICPPPGAGRGVAGALYGRLFYRLPDIPGSPGERPLLRAF